MIERINSKKELEGLIAEEIEKIRNLHIGLINHSVNNIETTSTEENNESNSIDIESEIREANLRLEEYRNIISDYNSVIENVGKLRSLYDQRETITDEEERNRLDSEIENLSNDIIAKRSIIQKNDNLHNELQEELRKIYVEPQSQNEPIVAPTIDTKILEETNIEELEQLISEHNENIRKLQEEMRDYAGTNISTSIESMSPTDMLTTGTNNFEKINELITKLEEEKRLIEELTTRKEEVEKAQAAKKDEEDNIFETDDIEKVRAAIQEHKEKSNEIAQSMRDYYEASMNNLLVSVDQKEELENNENSFIEKMREMNDNYLRELEIIAKLEQREKTLSNPVVVEPAKEPVTNAIKEPIKTSEPVKKEPKIEHRTLAEILDDIRSIYEPDENGLNTYAEITEKQANRYDRSSIKVTKRFKEEVTTKNFWYNIVNTVPGLLIRIPVNLVRKATGALFLSRKAKEEIEKVKENIDKLSDADLEVLSKEYKGAVAQNFISNVPIDGYIREAIARYQYRTEINPKRKQLADDYIKLITTYNEYEDARLYLTALERGMKPKGKEREPEIEETKETMNKLLSGAKSSLVGAKPDSISVVDRIRRIQQNKRDLLNLQSSGILGLKEDIKSKKARRNRKGWRFSKGYNTSADEKIAKQEAKLAKALENALRTNDDRHALAIFIEHEKLEASSTIAERKLLRGGVVSTGMREYDPLVRELDYSQDMFIRNLLSTIAIAGVAANVANNIHNIHERSQIDDINTHNSAINDKMHQHGETLFGNKEKVADGLEYNRAQTRAGIQNNNELTDVRGNDWNTSSDSYVQSDLAHHAAAEELFQTTSSQISKLGKQLKDGDISYPEFLSGVNKVNTKLHSEYNQTIDEGLKVLEDYSASHPSIELDALIENYKYMVEHAKDIDNLSDVGVQSVEIGEDLVKLSFEELKGLESNLALEWAPIISGVLLAGYAANDANRQFDKSDLGIVKEIKDTITKDEYREEKRAAIVERTTKKKVAAPIKEENKVVTTPAADKTSVEDLARIYEDEKRRQEAEKQRKATIVVPLVEPITKNEEESSNKESVSDVAPVIVTDKNTISLKDVFKVDEKSDTIENIVDEGTVINLDKIEKGRKR